MRLAWRNLTRDRGRLALSVAGVAISIMLILLLRGYLDGTYRQASAYFEETPGDLIVAQVGTSSGIGGSSKLPAGTETAVRALPGVARTLPVLMQGVILDLHGRKQFTFAVGYDPALGGGPWRLASGREPQADGEVVVDRLLAREHGLDIGDPVTILGRDLELVGTSEGTTFWIGTYAFMTRETLAALTSAPGAVSFVFVSVDEPGSVGKVAARLAELDGVNVLTKAEIVTNQRRTIGRIYDAPLGLMVGIAFLVGVLTVGLVIYVATVERRQEYGVLKAIGGSGATLYRVVLIQALIASLLGAVIGIGLGYLGAATLMLIRPQFNIVIEPWVAGGSLLASVLMAVLAALIPSRTINRLAPSEVLRS
jgi:putative ABC transport system permease protein